jgi:hypothetical protein
VLEKAPKATATTGNLGVDEFTVIVDTVGGVIVRRIQAARILPEGVDHGPAAEDATRDAAAAWGMPDFVFKAVVLASGSGVRELGDAILTVGEVAAVVQVKARTAASGDQQRERAWLDKRIAKAARQAAGTVRRMKAEGQVALVNERGREIGFDAGKKVWVPVVIIDHPRDLHDYVPTVGAVVLLRREWEFLFEQLKSTDAVVRYLHRVHGYDAIPLGREVMRYYDLALADAAGGLGAIDPRLRFPGTRHESTPTLPQTPVGYDDREAHLLLRMVLEDIATFPLSDGMSENDRLEVLAALDTLPVGSRASLGRTLIDWVAEVSSTPTDSLRWRMRNVVREELPCLIFAASNKVNASVEGAWIGYVRLRHQQLLDAVPERANLITVGVLITPGRVDDNVMWEATMIATRGAQDFSEEERLRLLETFGEPGDGTLTVHP